MLIFADINRENDKSPVKLDNFLTSPILPPEYDGQYPWDQLLACNISTIFIQNKEYKDRATIEVEIEN